jgi:plastocyanin
MNVTGARALAIVACLVLPVLSSSAAEPEAAAISYGDQLTRVVLVKISNFTFEPASITVAAGTQIKWVNEDDVPHTVTGSDADSPLHSGALDTDDSYTVTTDQVGTYKYFCAIHPHMVGTVIVGK